MNTVTLRWHLQNRSDGCMDEYATLTEGGDGVSPDEHGKKIYMINECRDGGYVLYETQNPLEEVWCFDTQEQARREAELRYASSRRM